jgi:small subunit ribosomal protein S3
MGQKANPKSLRLGISDDWESTWYDFYNYSDKVMQDYVIRNYLNNEFSRCGVSSIRINRKSDQIDVIVTVSRPGVIFGKNSMDLDLIRLDLSKKINVKNLVINILENKSPDATASLVASWICSQIERRIPFRRAMKSAIQKCLKSGVNGVKVSCSGRLAGIEIARCEWYKEGKIPLHTLRANIDYSLKKADTLYGTIGVKVWLYKGDVIQSDYKKVVENEYVKS